MASRLIEYLGLHDNSVLFKDVHRSELIFEYCDRGQLEEVVREQPSMTENEKRAIGKRIILCLTHLHEHHFVHCNLNVNNVFITSAMDVKVGDIQGQL